ncbi:MAG: tetratricopeptide repeat protein [Kiritimatiellales bacterium]|nr:tetratricopeptide repeat protein [Pontiella sp.]NNJ70159.1 tetratricopeptide repeat protein [Kiritimatiellales bacterium]
MMCIKRSFLIWALFGIISGLHPCHGAVQAAEVEVEDRQKKDSYSIEEQGRRTFRSLFDANKGTSAEQWAYARKTQDRGNLKKAERRMLYLHRRWPNSKEAPWAARARADMLLERGLDKEAFDAYQFLIDTYPSRMADYDSVLELQYEIAEGIMNHRRLRWVFGGYRTPEYAIDYFETVIRNGPQWAGASKAQFMVGKCYQDSDNYEMAITAYGILGYRYPDSAFAEEAAWQQIVCMDTLREDYPVSPEILDRILTASTVFLSTFPQSVHKDEIISMRNSLYEVLAGRVFDEAAFYAKVPKKLDAAVLYYEKMIKEYPKSKLVPVAQQRIAKLKALLAMPVQARTPDAPRSRPLSFAKDVQHADG